MLLNSDEYNTLADHCRTMIEVWTLALEGASTDDDRKDAEDALQHYQTRHRMFKEHAALEESRQTHFAETGEVPEIRLTEVTAQEVIDSMTEALDDEECSGVERLVLNGAVEYIRAVFGADS